MAQVKFYFATNKYQTQSGKTMKREKRGKRRWLIRGERRPPTDGHGGEAINGTVDLLSTLYPSTATSHLKEKEK